MTFFGFTQEERNEEREQLEASLQEAVIGRTQTMEEVFAELGIEEDETDEQEKEMLADLHAQERKYNQFQLVAECKKVKKLLAAQ